MKVHFDSTYAWDFDAPTLEAESVMLEGCIQRYRVWCVDCCDYHYHGPRDGHREAHSKIETDYSETGYNIELISQ